MGINTFISQFQGGARPNRYRVAFTWPGLVGSPNVRDEIFISAAGLPASTIGMIQVPYMGRQIPVPGTEHLKIGQLQLSTTRLSHTEMRLSVGLT